MSAAGRRVGTVQGVGIVALQHLDNNATIETSEMRDFARVLKAALIMIVRYLERRYGV